jgi:hypothetical protein
VSKPQWRLIHQYLHAVFDIGTVRGYGLALERAGDISLLGALMSSILGGTMFVACQWSNAEPPLLVVRHTVVALLLFVFDLTFLPAIAGP